MKKSNRDLILVEKIMNVKEMLFAEMGKSYNDYEISSTELMILYFLRHSTEKIKTGGLSAAIYVPMSTLTGILDKMEKKGIIIRQRSLEDRRSVFIEINPDFEAHSGEFLDGTAAMMMDIKTEMTSVRFEQFFESLSLLEKILKKRVEKKDE